MDSSLWQRNLCNPDRSHRKPLLRGLVNGKSHLRRNRRCRPPRQGTEKERREWHPIPTAPLTPTAPPRSHCIPSSPIRFPHHSHTSFPTGPTILHSESLQPFSEILGLVVPLCSRPRRKRVWNGQSPFEPFCTRGAFRKSCNSFEANGIFLKPSGHYGQRDRWTRKGRGAGETRKAVLNP